MTLRKPVLEDTESDWQFAKWLMNENARKKRKYVRRKYSKYITQYRPSHHFAHKDGHVLEHRLVWEYYHKAILLSWANVYHINGNPCDNKIENLRVKMRAKPVKGVRIASDLSKILKKMGLES